MSGWDFAATAVIAIISGGLGLFLLKWLKEHLDRKARVTSARGRQLLEQADLLCGMARALDVLVQEGTGSHRYRDQASALWEPSAVTILNVWEANAWILRRKKRWRLMGDVFRCFVTQLEIAAKHWHKADAEWRKAQGITPSEFAVGGVPEREPSPEVERKCEAAMQCREAIKDFLSSFQELHNELQPVVREYASPPDATPE